MVSEGTLQLVVGCFLFLPLLILSHQCMTLGTMIWFLL